MPDCPRCGAEWEEVVEASPFGKTRFFAGPRQVTRRFPVRRGRCLDCAGQDASFDQRRRYVAQEGLQGDFLAWLLRRGGPGDPDLRDIWDALVAHDPDLMEVRVREFIEEERDAAFGDWALDNAPCGRFAP